MGARHVKDIRFDVLSSVSAWRAIDGRVLGLLRAVTSALTVQALRARMCC